MRPIDSTNLNTRIDGLMNQNLDAFTKTGMPNGPSKGPDASPDAPKTRASADGGMAPRGGSLDKLADTGKKIGTDANKMVSEDGGDMMKQVIDATQMNMKMQMQMNLIQMQKGLTEAHAKTIKDTGTKIAQAA